MKAIRFHQIGTPEVLRWEDVAEPALGAGEVLIKVRVAGVNFADTLLRRGAYLTQPHLPEIPGFEASGMVEKVADRANEGLIGKRVVVLSQHCYAEYVEAPARELMFLPEGMSFEDGAAFPLQALTAYHLLFTADQVVPGKSILIHAAAGGVGLLAIQMAKQAGARVFGTVSTPEKAALAKQMGADEVINYAKSDFAEEVLKATGGRGVDLVLDSVGRATFVGSLRALAPFGHLISYGAASGPADPPRIGPLFEKSLKLSAFWLMTLSKTPQIAAKGVARVLEWITSGKLRLQVGLKLPITQAAEAHRKMEARETVGKILLTVE
ncbi:MAG TPA: quinone oxidoreductase [Terriglobia bacterium]|nr:quinone oxidoreductase [Terriglobia bacterium]